MGLIWEGIKEALRLLFTLDPEVLRITFLSLKVSVTATLVSLFLGVGAGLLIALNRFPGKHLSSPSSTRAWVCPRWWWASS